MLYFQFLSRTVLILWEVFFMWFFFFSGRGGAYVYMCISLRWIDFAWTSLFLTIKILSQIWLLLVYNNNNKNLCINNCRSTHPTYHITRVKACQTGWVLWSSVLCNVGFCVEVYLGTRVTWQSFLEVHVLFNEKHRLLTEYLPRSNWRECWPLVPGGCRVFGELHSNRFPTVNKNKN